MRALLKNWQKDTGDTFPVDFTPDGYDRETGNTLRKDRKRETMP